MGLAEELKRMQRNLTRSRELTPEGKANIIPALGTLAYAVDVGMISWKEIQAKFDAQMGKDTTKQEQDIQRLKAERLNLGPDEPITASREPRNLLLETPVESQPSHQDIASSTTMHYLLEELMKRNIRPENVVSTLESEWGRPPVAEPVNCPSGVPATGSHPTVNDIEKFQKEFGLPGAITSGESATKREDSLSEMAALQNSVNPRISEIDEEKEGDEAQDPPAMANQKNLAEIKEEKPSLPLEVIPYSSTGQADGGELETENGKPESRNTLRTARPGIANEKVIQSDPVIIEGEHNPTENVSPEEPLVHMRESTEGLDDDFTTPPSLNLPDTVQQIMPGATPICIIKPNIYISTAPDIYTAREFDVIINVAAEVPNPFPAEDVIPGKFPELQEAIQKSLPKKGPARFPLSLSTRRVPVMDSHISVKVPTDVSSGFELVDPRDNAMTTGQDRLEYFHVAWTYGSQFSQSLDYLCVLLENHVLSRKRILIHGNTDYQRPSILLLAFNMLCTGQSYISSLEELKSSSAVISLTLDMERQLGDWAQRNLPGSKNTRPPVENATNSRGVTGRGSNATPVQKQSPGNYLTTSQVRRRRVNKGTRPRSNSNPNSPTATSSSSNANTSNAIQPVQHAQPVQPAQSVQPVQTTQTTQSTPSPGANWDNAPLVVALGFQKSHKRVLMIKVWVEDNVDDAEFLGQIRQEIVKGRGWVRRWLSFKTLGTIAPMPFEPLDTPVPDRDNQKYSYVRLTSVNLADAVAHLEHLNGYCPQLVYYLNKFPISTLVNQTNWIQFATALDKPLQSVTQNAINPPSSSQQQQQQQLRPKFLLYLTDTWSAARVVSFTMFWMISSLGVSVAYARMMDDDQTGFTIGSYLLTWGSMLVATIAIAASVV